MSQSSSARWIEELKLGDEHALKRLCDRYYDRLSQIARRKLTGVPRRVADEFAIANEVLLAFHRRAIEGDFDDVREGDLLPLLVRLTHDRVVDEVRRLCAAKRGGGKTRGDSVFAPLGGGADAAVNRFREKVESPSTREIVADQVRAILARLPDESMRAVFLLRAEGYSNAEIASELNVSIATVERKRRRIKDALSDLEKGV